MASILENTWRCTNCGERYKEFIEGEMIDGERYCSWCALGAREQKEVENESTDSD